MKRKISKLFIIIILLLSYSGCNKCDKNILEEINIEYWNKHTIIFLSSKVDFSSFNISKERQPPKYPKKKVDGFTVNNMEEDINHMLKCRSIAINELINTYKVTSCKLVIREYYRESFYLYIIRDDQGDMYFIRVNGIDKKIVESYLVTDESQKYSFGADFDAAEDNEIFNVFLLENGLKTLMIYSKFQFINDSLVIEYPHVRMLDQ